MKLTVAICTWNRCELLKQALARMTTLASPVGVEWEIIVVNNNCTDATDDVLAHFATRLPLRRIHESKPGLSNARNAATREAQGDYIVWTDDDTLVDENWLLAYVRAIEQRPDAAFFGGPIRPWWAVAPPRWLAVSWPCVADAYALKELGDEPLQLTGGRHVPYGANYVVRAREQKETLYDRRLGRVEGVMTGGEETSLIAELLAKGCEGWWVPDAPVQHFIQPDRMTVDYLRRYYVGIGQSYARLQGHGSAAMWLGRPRWLWKKIVAARAQYIWHRLTAPPDIWVRDLADSSRAWGEFVELSFTADHG